MRTMNLMINMVKKFLAFYLLTLLPLQVSAQKFEPNTNWPYLYENFTPGVIYFDGNTKSEAELNIHLWGNVLHYVGQDGKIFQSKDKNVIRVEIGDDAYIFMNQKLVKILAVEGTNLLVSRPMAISTPCVPVVGELTAQAPTLQLRETCRRSMSICAVWISLNWA